MTFCGSYFCGSFFGSGQTPMGIALKAMTVSLSPERQAERAGNFWPSLTRIAVILSVSCSTETSGTVSPFVNRKTAGTFPPPVHREAVFSKRKERASRKVPFSRRNRSGFFMSSSAGMKKRTPSTDFSSGRNLWSCQSRLFLDPPSGTSTKRISMPSESTE